MQKINHLDKAHLKGKYLENPSKLWNSVKIKNRKFFSFLFQSSIHHFGSQMTLLSLCRGGNDLSEETKRNFESWLQQQQLGLGLNPMVPTSNHHHTQSPQPDGGGTIGSAGGTIGPPHPALLQYSHKTRMRTSFDPELELPRLQRWFGENQHPSRQQIQHYVSELNALESRRGRKPLDVNNVVYWFKNARAAQKRAENRGVNGYSPPGLSPRGASIVSEDCTDEEEDSRNQVRVRFIKKCRYECCFSSI